MDLSQVLQNRKKLVDEKAEVWERAGINANVSFNLTFLSSG